MITENGNMKDFVSLIMKYKNKKFLLAIDSDKYNKLFDFYRHTGLKSFLLGGNRVFLLRLDRKDLPMESFLRGANFSGAYIESKIENYDKKQKSEIIVRLSESENIFYIENISQSERS